jgi:hypothetical protein
MRQRVIGVSVAVRVVHIIEGLSFLFFASSQLQSELTDEFVFL